MRDPDTFDWETLETPFNPFPRRQLCQGTFFGAIGGYLEYLREHAGLSPKLFELASLAGQIRDHHESKKG